MLELIVEKRFLGQTERARRLGKPKLTGLSVIQQQAVLSCETGVLCFPTALLRKFYFNSYFMGSPKCIHCKQELRLPGPANYSTCLAVEHVTLGCESYRVFRAGKGNSADLTTFREVTQLLCANNKAG